MRDFVQRHWVGLFFGLMAAFVIFVAVVITGIITSRDAHQDDCASIHGYYLRVRNGPDVCLDPATVLRAYP